MILLNFLNIFNVVISSLTDYVSTCGFKNKKSILIEKVSCHFCLVYIIGNDIFVNLENIRQGWLLLPVTITATYYSAENNYGCKKFYSTGPRCWNYKTFFFFRTEALENQLNCLSPASLYILVSYLRTWTIVGVTSLSITTPSMMTLSIKGLITALSIKTLRIQHYHLP